MTLDIDIGIDLPGFALDVAFNVESGETVALVGPNGAGKSTVLRAIAGLSPIHKGSITFERELWNSPEKRKPISPEMRRIGFVFQNEVLFDHLTAIENVAFGLRARRVPEPRRTAYETLARLGIEGIAEQRPRTLSGGQAQRVALARAIAINPRVLLLDEPLAALDVQARGTVRGELKRTLDATDAARIIVTHDPVDAYALADRVVVIEGGRVTQTGTLEELAYAPRTNYIADLLGTNVVRGVLSGDVLLLDLGGELIVGAHDVADGPALGVIRPQAISLHDKRPEGSPRNVWQTEVVGIEHNVDRVRVRLGPPVGLVAEVTRIGLESLTVAAIGAIIWASVKASEVSVSAL